MQTAAAEAGDDRNKDAEIARLIEMYAAETTDYPSDIRGIAPGEFVLMKTFEMPRQKLPGGLAVASSIEQPRLSRRAHIEMAAYN